MKAIQLTIEVKNTEAGQGLRDRLIEICKGAGYALTEHTPFQQSGSEVEFVKMAPAMTKEAKEQALIELEQLFHHRLRNRMDELNEKHTRAKQTTESDLRVWWQQEINRILSGATTVSRLRPCTEGSNMGTVTREDMRRWFDAEGMTVSRRTMVRYHLRWLNKPDLPPQYDEEEARAAVAKTIAYKRSQLDAPAKHKAIRERAERYKRDRLEAGIRNRVRAELKREERAKRAELKREERAKRAELKREERAKRRERGK